ncbi:MAG: packaged DNA stabilization protein [Bdellovibrio sp.]
MKFQGFIGPAYTLDSVNVDCQRCVNMYPEVDESGFAKEGQVSYLKSTPGLDQVLTVGTGPIRMMLRIPVPTTAQDSRFPRILYLIISGNQAYTATYSAGTWTTTLLKKSDGTAFTLSTSSGGISGAAVTNYATALTAYYSAAFYADGTNLYKFWYSFGIGPLDTYSEIVAGHVVSHVTLTDGYFVINEVNTGTFYVSDWNSILFSPLNFASAEGDPDNIIAHLANTRYLWFFNEKTTEIWSNTGNASFPFERISGGFVEIGCVAKYSAAKIDGFVFWLGRSEFGQGIVYAASGLTPERISTHAIEQAISKYADMSTATAYTYQANGHSFYVLNFAEATWVYDLNTKLWHERAYTNAGTLQRHRTDCHVFFPEQSMHLLGDYSSNVIYKFNDLTYTDNTNAITRLRTAPHISASLMRVFCKSLQLDMETGVGLVSGQGSDPQVVLDWSDDGGHTWSSESWATAGGQVGGIGAYKTRVIWRRLGKFRDRVFRVKITDPVKVVLLGAELDIEQGAS